MSALNVKRAARALARSAAPLVMGLLWSRESGYAYGLWRCLVAHTSGAAFSGTSVGNWTLVAGDLTTQAAISAYLPFIVAARNPDLLIVGAVTRDSNGASTSAPVVWPDGSAGVYTATSVSAAFPGAVDAYTITKVTGGVTTTYTQPAVTRNSSGAATTVPAMTAA